MKDFKVTIPIKQSIVDEVLICALEGGSNYWYIVNESLCTTPEKFERSGHVHYEILDKVYQGGTLPVFDAENDEEKLGDLTRESIQKGLDLMSKDHSETLFNIIDENYDANDADIFFQLCVIGEITFG